MGTKDATLDPSLRSFVESANDGKTDFPIQNLPYGVGGRPGEQPRAFVAIGDAALDLAVCSRAGYFKHIAVEAADVFARPALNEFLAFGPGVWRDVRERISEMLREDTPTLRDDAETRDAAIIPRSDLEMGVPVLVGDYTDFYASIHHATNVGSMFRPDNPLMPNYKHLPVGYHGRASSIMPTGAPVRRPMGQVMGPEDESPRFAPSRLLDYELEMGAVIGVGNPLGQRVPVSEAFERIFGLLLVNDWSARDVQKWEYQPLGPFNAKNFATTVSPWIITLAALRPFHVDPPSRAPDDPPLLDYLVNPGGGAYDVTLEVAIETEQMRRSGAEPHVVSRGSFKDMYWTLGQMLAHHTSTGCNMRPGDVIASGTVSGPEESARGCLLELTWRGENPVRLPSGEERTFLQDADAVILRGRCESEGAAPIGFGECRAEILPAVE